VVEQKMSGIIRSKTDTFVEDACKKVIVTTDKLNLHPNTSDSYRTGNCVPIIPQQFVEHFIEAYNAGNKINKVLVEVELLDKTLKYFIKLNGNNEVSVLIQQYPIGVVEEAAEKMYSEKEARAIWEAGQEYWKTSGASITFEELTEQFKKK
jgi:hypothetical protein